MKMILTLAAAAAVALTASPALADPGGKGKGNKEWKHSDRGDHGGDRYRDGRDRDGDRYRNSYRNCPPGLAKKNNGCQPPGQAKKRWARGQRVPSGYNGYTSYNNIPREYRDRYNLDRDDRYIYENGTVYQVDRRTSVIQQILGGLIR